MNFLGPLLFCMYIFIYLFINYNAITNYILIIYELSNFDHLIGVMSQARVSGGNGTHDHYQGTLCVYINEQFWFTVHIHTYICMLLKCNFILVLLRRILILVWIIIIVIWLGYLTMHESF